MTTKLTSVLSSWKAFKLTELQHELEEVATQIAHKQDESDSSIKKLVELSRDFKKSNFEEEVRKQVVPLLKSFQVEIDQLNKRSKHSETAFLNVFKRMVDIIDPVPVLEYCMGLEKKSGHLADLEVENKNLKDMVSKYSDEIKNVNNQESVIKDLKDKMRLYENQMEESLKRRMRELEKDLTHQYMEKEKVVTNMQENSLQRLQVAESQAKKLQEMFNQSQSELFEYKSKWEENTVAKSDEMEILMNDFDHVSQELLLARKENLTLKSEIESLSASGTGGASSQDKPDLSSSESEMMQASFTAEILSKEKEIARLISDLKTLQEDLKTHKENGDESLSVLRNMLHAKDVLINKLESKINQQADYDEVKRELNIMKSVEFGFSDPQVEEGHQEHLPSESLEMLLLEKMKALQNENTLLKQKNAELASDIDAGNKDRAMLSLQVTEQKDLILKLESDLSSVHSLSNMYRGEGEGCSFASEAVAEAVQQSGSSVVITPKIPGMSSSASSSFGGVAPDFPSAAESLLPIISSQRERFRLRNESLESEVSLKGQQIVNLQEEIDSLRGDNLRLYEKIRFLQSYHGSERNESSQAEGRYRSQYEESLDPFSYFSKKEKFKRYTELSPFEKVTLSLGKLILGNKTARTVAFMYTVFLHCLIFIVLYMYVHSEACKRDMSSDCARRFAEHMQQVHGNDDFQNPH